MQHHTRGCTDKFIYQNHIYPTYKIGRTTFYNYLATPAVKELKELEERITLFLPEHTQLSRPFFPFQSHPFLQFLQFLHRRRCQIVSI